jgi:hypothetical protein
MNLDKFKKIQKDFKIPLTPHQARIFNDKNQKKNQTLAKKTKVKD